MAEISRLRLVNYRSYARLKIDTGGAKTIVITGKNGAGKTNILEAISMLSPAGPFRKAKPEQIGLVGAEDKTFTIFAQVGESAVGLSCDYGGEAGAKTIVANEANIAVHELAMLVKIVWITPLMDRLFSEAGAERRRFLDTLIGNFYPFYSEQVYNHAKLLAERARALKSPRVDATWADSIEEEIVRLGASIAAMRLEFEGKINAILEQSGNGFPRIKIRVSGFVEDMLRDGKAAETEAAFAHELKANRELFSRTYSPPVEGVHRSDFSAQNLDRRLPADQTSTGEQKMAVISIALASARMQKLYFDSYPIILCDEAVAHLDREKTALLFAALEAMPTQVWLSGIEAGDFEYFTGRSSLPLHIENSCIAP